MYYKKQGALKRPTCKVSGLRPAEPQAISVPAAGTVIAYCFGGEVLLAIGIALHCNTVYKAPCKHYEQRFDRQQGGSATADDTCLIGYV